jgi:hypothetical protein
MRPWRDLAGHVLNPSVEEGGDRHAGRFDAGAVLHLGQQTGALNLRLALGSLEGVPALLTLVGGVAPVNDDGPMAGRAFA